MKRASISTRSHHAAAMIMVVMQVGCASLNDSKEAVIHVSASRNTTEAARLTLVGAKVLGEGDVDRATTKFLAAVDADDRYGPAHNNLGLLHYEQGNLYQAVLAFEQAMDLMPHDPVVYYNLGLSLESAGKVFEAMDLYSQAVEMDPANPIFLGNLVRLRVRMGENDPILISQLQDLILIETRPDWRRWADRQLALKFNLTLDRGPASPDFDTGDGRDRDDSKSRLDDNIIDLTPPTDDQLVPESSGSLRSDPLSPPKIRSSPLDNATDQIEALPTPLIPDPDPFPQPPDERSGPSQADQEGSLSAPIQDNGSLNSLPPSIQAGAESASAPELDFQS